MNEDLGFLCTFLLKCFNGKLYKTITHSCIILFAKSIFWLLSACEHHFHTHCKASTLVQHLFVRVQCKYERARNADERPRGCGSCGWQGGSTDTARRQALCCRRRVDGPYGQLATASSSEQPWQPQAQRKACFSPYVFASAVHWYRHPRPPDLHREQRRRPSRRPRFLRRPPSHSALHAA